MKTRKLLIPFGFNCCVTIFEELCILHYQLKICTNSDHFQLHFDIFSIDISQTIGKMEAVETYLWVSEVDMGQ